VYSWALRIKDTNFHHVAVTKTGSAVIIYLDGMAETAPTYERGLVFNSSVAIDARGIGQPVSGERLMD